MSTRIRSRPPAPPLVPTPAFGQLARALAAALEKDWRSVARPQQLAPPGNWTIWLLMTGRGFGKTRSGAEWVRQQVTEHGKREIALVGPTMHDVRTTMIEGPSGILKCCLDTERPIFEPSRRLITWPNGAVAKCLSGDEPDSLRGGNFDCAWVDELASFRYPSSFDNLMLALRIGSDPQCCITTTPRPTKLIRSLLARSDCVVTRGKTAENRSNLARAFLTEIVSKYEGTRLGRQELDGELLEDVAGALWSRDLLDETRVTAAPEFKRIVVAIDPATTSGETADETGIVVCGLGVDGHGYVLADISGRYTPTEWARRAIEAHRLHLGDRVVAEKNQGGEMITATLHAIDPALPVKLVHASRGKRTRAEPISALFEQKRCHLVGVLSDLEDELCNFAVGFDAASAGFSPGRLDAMVWGFTELMGGNNAAQVDYLVALASNKGRITEGMLKPSNETSAPAPKTSGANLPWLAPKPTPDPVAVTLHAPNPFGAFQIDKTRYCADGDGLVAVAPEHVDGMIGMGCWKLIDPNTGSADAA